jgi:threonine dehydrogenase-like Zn-dependent dehydrogenase
MISSGALKVKQMITHEFRPEQAEEAYEFVYHHPEECLGVFFRW